MRHKAKQKYRIFAVAMLFPLLSGCFTAIVSSEAIQDNSDWFVPTAIYKSKADGGVAVAGTVAKAGERNGSLVYVIIPQKVLVAAHIQTKGSVSIGDIDSLPPKVRQGLCLQKTLNGDYEEIADVSKGDGGMSVNQRKSVNIKEAGWLPFAFVVDAVAFPLEIDWGKKMGKDPIN